MCPTDTSEGGEKWQKALFQVDSYFEVKSKCPEPFCRKPLFLDLLRNLKQSIFFMFLDANIIFWTEIMWQ